MHHDVANCSRCVAQVKEYPALTDVPLAVVHCVGVLRRAKVTVLKLKKRDTGADVVPCRQPRVDHARIAVAPEVH